MPLLILVLTRMDLPSNTADSGKNLDAVVDCGAKRIRQPGILPLQYERHTGGADPVMVVQLSAQVRD